MTVAKDLAETVTAGLRARAEHTGGRAAVLFVRDPGEPGRTESLTYRQLDEQARRIGSWLAARFPQGERILLLDTTGIGMVTAFFGCLYAGMIAVPAPPPGRHRHQRDRVTAIAHDAGVATALTTGAQLPGVRQWAEAERLELRHPAVDPSGAGSTADWRMPPTAPETVALLQYTSGSTSEPKGVMVTHRNLVHNAHLIGEQLELTERDRFGGWLPLYHDMGLIGQVISPLLLGSATVLMEPSAFVKRPHHWLRMIQEQHVALSPAPNFAFDLCRRGVTGEQAAELDLSGWKCAANGSEPVHAPTLAAFAERLAPAGFRAESLAPCYGMAEATLFVSGRRNRPAVVRRAAPAELERGEFQAVSRAGRALVGLGGAAGFDIRIVDPESGNVLPDGRIGEIWLRGASVAAGYWRRTELTEQVFRASTADGDGGYLRTGDAGMLFEGELFITGRYKEMFVFRGRNLFPQDLEHEVRRVHENLASGVGAVFSVAAPDEEIVVTHEIRARRGENEFGEISDRIRIALGREFGVPVSGIVLLRPGTVRRTTSGKIQRLTMRELFLGGELDALHEDISPELHTLRKAERRTRKELR